MINSRKIEKGGACGTYVGEIHTGFWWGNLGEEGHMEDLGIDGWITLKIDLKVIRWWAWTGFFWLRIGTGVGLF